MSIFKLLPEGWNQETFNLKNNTIEEIEKDQIMQGIVKECDENCNLYINLGNGITGIIPKDEVEGININKDKKQKENICKGKTKKIIQFKIKEIKENTPILSRKEVQKEALQYIFENYQKGESIKGIVKNITPYGAFIEIGGGIVGLAHIEDLSVARIKTPYERLKIGQKVNAIIKNIDKENKKISLSYKENYGTWQENADKFYQGEITKGIVRETEKNKNGIFIEITPNLVGMAEYKEGLEYGKTIDVLIKKIDYNRKKIKLVII